MSLDKSINSGKEKRKQYRGAKAIDHTCRNHGSCSYCEGARKHSSKKRELSAKDQEKETNIDAFELEYRHKDTKKLSVVILEGPEFYVLDQIENMKKEGHTDFLIIRNPHKFKIESF